MDISRDDNGDFSTKPVKFRAVPYYSWDNRQPGQMVVWLPEKPELAELPGEDGVLVDGIRARASHLFAHDTLTALHDTVAPKGSNDHDIPRMTWWDHKGTTEWAEYDFDKPRRVSAVEVYW